MNLRQLKKQDKRAAAILLTLFPNTVYPNNFGLDDGGRYSYEWRCSYEYYEWDSLPALEYLEQWEANLYMGECVDAHGDWLPAEHCPDPAPSAMRKLPAGYRWRGRRVVPVDKSGAMVRAAQRRAGY